MLKEGYSLKPSFTTGGPSPQIWGIAGGMIDEAKK